MNVIHLSRQTSRQGKVLSEVATVPVSSARLLDPHINFFSRLFVLWLSPLLTKAYRTNLVYDDLTPIRQNHRSLNLLKNWKIGQAVNIGVSLLLHFWWSFLKAFVTRLIAILLAFLNPILLSFLIDSASTEDPFARSLVLAILLFFVSQIKSFLNAAHNYMVGKDAVLISSLLTNTIQRKSLRISDAARSQWPSARITNLVAVDTEAIANALAFAHHSWAIALEILHLQAILVIIFVYVAIGIPVLGLIITILCYIPINFFASKFIKYFQALCHF
ncbi:hypothetical protein WR25_04719 [Diploscapter pachys]|uniref:ABC transmembrane type-1 domain-containing protein n=1 Tax=Diploscapter pachys TaxID=2018661 RepID=A0A2A2L616_9BILA|nr:hypothetical protein WR25_04719 [Diploscapter pachys]